MIYQGKALYPVREVTLHTAATPGDWHVDKTVHEMRDEIERWHTEKGWRAIGYHRVIAPDGKIAIGRSLWEIGLDPRFRCDAFDCRNRWHHQMAKR